MRRAPVVRILVPLLCLPAAGSAIIVLSVPPLSRFVPAPVESALRPIAAWLFALIAQLPADSLPGRLFYGSYAPLPAIFGANALAVHSALLALPPVALAVALPWWARRPLATASRRSPLEPAKLPLGRGRAISKETDDAMRERPTSRRGWS